MSKNNLKKIHSFLIITLFFFVIVNFYFIFISNNKYSTSYIFQNNFISEKIFLENNKKIIKNYDEIIKDYSFDKLKFHNFKIKKLNGFLSEGFLCLQENHLYTEDYYKIKNLKKTHLIRSISLQGAYFYNRDVLDKILIKYNHYKNNDEYKKKFLSFFNYCFNRSYHLNNMNESIFNFIELNIDRNNELKVLKNKITDGKEKKNFEFLIKFEKTNFNFYYYLSIILFTLTFSLFVFSIFNDVFKKKTK